LQRGQRAYKPTSLALFERWSDVQEYARSHAGRDLLPVVQIIDREGTDYLRQLLSRVTTDESQADYVVSTVHRAKGLEWNRVKVAGDFRFKTEDDGRTTLADDEKRLLYVALTRARRLLDLSELRADLLKVTRPMSGCDSLAECYRSKSPEWPCTLNSVVEVAGPAGNCRDSRWSFACRRDLSLIT
jgi:superfamily I DNA/RNA helicase